MTYYGPGSRADFQHAVFPRRRSDSQWRPLEAAPPVRGRLYEIANALGLIAFGIAVLVVLPFFFE